MPRSPEFYPARSGSTVTLSLVDPNTADFNRIYIERAPKKSTNFTKIAEVDIADFPYADTIPDTSKRYKYKMGYVEILSKEIWDETTEVWDTTTELWYSENSKGVKSISKFTDT